MDEDRWEEVRVPLPDYSTFVEGKALEVARRMKGELLKSEKGFEELIKTLDKFFMKDKNSEKLEKATEYFSVYRRKDEKVTYFLLRQKKIRTDWKRVQGDKKEMEGLMLIHQAGINNNVVMGMCGEDRSYENVWRSVRKIFGGKKVEGKRGKDTSWMGEEKGTRENPMGIG